MDTVVEENPLSFATSRIVTMVKVSRFQSFGPGCRPHIWRWTHLGLVDVGVSLEFPAIAGGHYSRELCECQAHGSHRSVAFASDVGGQRRKLGGANVIRERREHAIGQTQRRTPAVLSSAGGKHSSRIGWRQATAE